MNNGLLGLTAIVVAFTTVAMIFDLKRRILPNWLTVGSLGVAILYHTVTSGTSGLVHSLSGFAVGFSLLLVLWLIGGGGGGDVKLMGAVGAWLGAPMTLIVFLLSAFLGLLSLVVMVTFQAISRGSKPDSAVGGSETDTTQIEAARHRIPYAVPVALATWLVMALKLIAQQA